MRKPNCVPAIGNRQSSIVNATPSSRRAFTLVEVLVVVSILGIIAAFVFPAINRAVRYKENAEIANKFQQAILAFELYYEENGKWPANRSPGVMTPELEDYYFPYYGVDWWTDDTGVGGDWDWDDISGSCVVCLADYFNDFTISEEQFLELDRMLDDGDLSKGNFQRGFIDDANNRSDYGCLIGTH